MKKKILSLVPVTPAAARPVDSTDSAALLHLRITGRHGVFLLQRGAQAVEEAVVDTRADGGIACTCHATMPGQECRHVALLRACGFLEAA